MDSKTLENIMEITSLFEFHNALGKFKECTEPVSYFDQFKSSIENWAAEFEENFDEDTMDYLHEIEAFAVKKFEEMGWLLEETRVEKKRTATDSAFVILTVVSESKYGSDLVTSLHPSLEEAEKEAERLKDKYEKEFETTYFNYQVSVISTSDLETVMEGKASNDAPLPLTAGTLRMLSEGENIPQLEAFLEGRPDDQFLDLLNRDDYIATVLWSKADIETALEEKGYPVTEDNVNAVINSGMLKCLGDCTDGDWEVIYQTIDAFACKYNTFTILSSLKQRYLMLEALYGTAWADSIVEGAMKAGAFLYSSIDSEYALEKNLSNSLDFFLESGLDKDLLEEWKSDYSLYTRKKYGNKSFNEIENPNFIEELLEKAISLIPEVNDEGPFALSIYDLNDELVYFNSEEEMSSFARNYAIAHATAYKASGGSFEELWSI